jgi:hypothetical protein
MKLSSIEWVVSITIIGAVATAVTVTAFDYHFETGIFRKDKPKTEPQKK